MQALIPLRLDVGENVTGEDLVQEVTRRFKECRLQGGGVVWKEIVDSVSSGDSSLSPIELAISSNSTSVITELQGIEVPGLAIDSVSNDFAWPCAALSISLDDCGTDPSMTVTYFTDIVAEDSATSAVECWRAFLNSMSSNHKEVATKVPLLSTAGERGHGI